MVKSGTERSDKYGAKYDAEVVRTRYTATATMAKASQVVKQAWLAGIAGQVRSLLNGAGILPVFTILYLSFANKLFAIVDRFGGGFGTQVYSETARATALLEIAKWADMTADDDILKDIWTIYATALGTAPSPIP
jgi:hypothetical protein